MNITLKATSLALVLLASVAEAKDLKFASFMAPTHPYASGAFEPFAQAVADSTGGALNIRIYHGGELGAGPVEQYGRVVDGVAELAVSLPGYTASQFPLTLTAELPGMLDEATGTETLWSHIEVLAPEYRRVQLIGLWSSAENLLFTRNKPVRTLDDIRGLKVRVPSRNTGLLVEAWGATPVSMPVSEIYNAMQTGVIDAAMIDGTGINAFRLGEVANYITRGMDTTNSPFFVVMNRDAYNGLSDAEKAAIDAAGRQLSLDGQKVQISVAEQGLADFGATAGKEVITLTEDEAAPFNAAALTMVEKVVAETRGAQAVADALRAD
ncbi:MAG: TRAP transporter substrate-binding protein [Paracoccus sp. (in: a-proteobacteria)]|uniref:TRAP transporter substrate-binding protein n=1 Tax=Paracoccus sp. TaxID=267 RepID=UPI0026DF511F|nr:TRAP transporter substrate-binding protein [Paracoccus sp. (in: a-proteobacteria)]MDO5613885.1 TRAP transporter substrate-binding protein [Paracoccus sp. (in: a-proteobacteria)]